ncbi:Phage Mu protein F like protein [Chryseobacterium oranimense]|uniref:Phage Mu protein F like protein n=1 Tax=Chryseobacterium oranimense TaxID=421058 RepID=A0A1M5V1H8_9FLAO|nr:phage minor head protein [Chryseobacterium oranimense]SHH69020.1 Phage Mu protein F like protein [Chryseobacterium oranimense]
MSDNIYQSFIQHHNAYEAKALKQIIIAIKDFFSNIPFKNLNFENAKNIILLNGDEDLFIKTIFKIHYKTGMAYGRYIYSQFKKENPIQIKKYKPLPFFNEAFQSYILSYFNLYAGTDIRSIPESLADNVVREISNGTFENETIEEMQKRIYRTINKPDFYMWQALRIARTEVSAAMNYSKEIAGNVSGVLFDKVWIGRNDGRERASHIAMNGKKVSKDEEFEVGGYKMKYPCDRSSGVPAREIINCRCTYGFEAKRDEFGRLIFTD